MVRGSLAVLFVVLCAAACGGGDGPVASGTLGQDGIPSTNQDPPGSGPGSGEAPGVSGQDPPDASGQDPSGSGFGESPSFDCVSCSGVFHCVGTLDVSVDDYYRMVLQGNQCGAYPDATDFQQFALQWQGLCGGVVYGGGRPDTYGVWQSDSTDHYVVTLTEMGFVSVLDCTRVPGLPPDRGGVDGG